MGAQEDLVAGLYDAAMEPTAWSDVGSRLCTAFNAVSFLIVVQNRHNLHLEMLETNWTAAQLDEYAAYYYKIDRWMEEGLKQPAMVPLIGDNYYPDADFIKTEIYTDFGVPYDIRHLLAEWTCAPDGAQVSLAIHGSSGRGAFGEDQARHIGQLFPHLLRSVQIRRRLRDAQGRAAVGETALDELAIGVVIARRDGRCRFANKNAQRFAARNDGFSLQVSGRDRAVAAAQATVTQRLRALVAGVCTGAGQASCGGSLRLPSTSGGRGYAVTVTPLPRALHLSLSQPTQLALLLIVNLDAAPILPEDRLRAVYGLTPAEARLAAAFANGKTRTEYAAAEGLSNNTIKTQLASAFAKLGVTRESEFVRLILALPIVDQR